MKAHLLKEFCGLPDDKRIADPVEPIFPNLLLLRHLRVERIRVDVRGDSSRVERRIEVRDIDHLRQPVGGQLDQFQCRRIMPTKGKSMC